MDRMDKVINALVEAQKKIEGIKETDSKPKIIIEMITGLFPYGLGQWCISLNYHSSLCNSKKTGTLTIDLPINTNGDIITSLQSFKHEVLSVRLRNTWGDVVSVDGKSYRRKYQQIPSSEFQPKTWKELIDHGLGLVQEISDILFEVYTTNETKLQKNL